MDCIINYWEGLLENKTFMHILLAWLDTIFPIYVFVACSQYTFKETWQEIRNNRRLLIKAVILTSFIIPLVAAGVLTILTVPILLAGIMLIASTAPGDPFDLVETHGKKGGLLMASGIMIVLVLVMPLTVPAWMWIFSQWFPLNLSTSPMDIFLAVAPKVIPPMVIALILRQFLPVITEKIANILHWYFRISALLITIYFIPFAIGKIFTFGLYGYIAMFIVTTLTLFSGYYLAESEGVERKDRISIALTVSLGNMAAVLFIAHHCYPLLNMLDFLMVIFGWIVLRWAIIWVWYFFFKFRLSRQGKGES
jgi:predicted Na+-dependent transporter